MKKKIDYNNDINEMKEKFRFCEVSQEDKIHVRLPTAAWRQVLLEYNDTLVKGGFIRKLKGKSIGAGVIEIRIEKGNY